MLKISEAASLALHTVVLLACNEQQRLSTREIAGILNGSEAHLAKVLQRLSRAGIVNSTRGPKGGFNLSKPADRISLLDVWEAIEGPLEPSNCLLDKPICTGSMCLLGNLLSSVTGHIREYLELTKLSDLNTIFAVPEKDRRGSDQAA